MCNTFAKKSILSIFIFYFQFIELQSTYEIKLSELSNELAIQTQKYSDLEKTYEGLHPNSQHNEVESELKEHINSLNMRLTEASEEKIKLEDKLKYHENLFLITVSFSLLLWGFHMLGFCSKFH